jgi:hypothetical protein
MSNERRWLRLAGTTPRNADCWTLSARFNRKLWLELSLDWRIANFSVLLSTEGRNLADWEIGRHRRHKKLSFVYWASCQRCFADEQDAVARGLTERLASGAPTKGEQ